MPAKPLPYQIIRSRRKTLALVIDKEARLIVRAPLHMPERDICEFINRKRRWIHEKQQQVKTLEDRYSPISLESGGKLLYLGNYYTILRKDCREISLQDKQLVLPLEATQNQVVAWLMSQARIVLFDRARHYARVMGVEYSALKISQARKRWGSCSAKNSLNLSWRLIMCPMEVIDYLVVHELSHIPHKNHSAQFWTCVKEVIPDYKVRQKWLKENRKLIDLL